MDPVGLITSGAVLPFLGEGAAGKVFRCEDLAKNNMFVALKLLHAKDPRWENFFRREFEVLSRLHHPNLVSVYDFGPAPEENTWYFTQELVVGRPLLESANFITIALLPDRIREQYGFSALPPVFVRKALVEGGAQYVRRAVIPLLPDRLRLVPSPAA